MKISDVIKKESYFTNDSGYVKYTNTTTGKVSYVWIENNDSESYLNNIS